MFCEKCGTQNPEGSQFCSACGSPLKAPAAAGAGAAASRKPNIKTLAVLGVAVLAIIVLLTVFFGGKDGGEADQAVGGQNEVQTSDLAGRWYCDGSAGRRRVFWFQNSGTLTTWEEEGGFTETKGDNGNGTHMVLAHWQFSDDNTLELICSESSAALTASYFGSGAIEPELSGDGSEITFHVTGGSDLTLQKYPESRW